MFLTGETFDYQLCPRCSVLQIAELPVDVEQYYPDNYYSFDQPALGLKTRVKEWLCLNGPPQAFQRMAWFESSALRSVAPFAKSVSVLDIGCGSGHLLSAMRRLGFTRVSGADPYIDESFETSNGVPVKKCELADIDGRYDVVMMHHSLEHMWDQQSALKNVRRLLTADGTALIRIPTLDSWAWTEFGANWAHLDPPRHFYLHSRKSIRLALEQAGLSLRRIYDDSSRFGLVGSVKAMQGLSTISAAPIDLGRYSEVDVSALNREGRGDCIAVYAGIA